jgi:hypothetical protein
MINFDAVKLEIKELRNEIGDDSKDWRYIMDAVDLKLMDAWLACNPSVTSDENDEVLSVYTPEYKQITRELYNAIIEIDDVIHSINTLKGRLLTLVEELRDINSRKLPWQV